MNPGGFSSFGTGTGFGTSNTSSLFGSSQPASTSLFGSAATTQPQTSSLFSSSAGFSGFSSSATTVQVGTTVKFVPLNGQDTINKNGSAQTISTNHQCITAMKEYKGKSLEELRFEDYQANRKTAQTSAFGSTSGSSLFGSTTQPAATTSSAFGGSSLFGNTTSTGFGGSKLFGSTTTSTPATTSLFGSTAQPAQTTSSFFGSAAPSTTSTGFGGFGSTTQPATTSVFGQSTAAKPSIFGGLGQTSNTTSTGLFSSGTTTASTTTGGIFGQQAAKPAFGSFGSATTTTTSSPFSFSSQPAAQPAATTSIFGTTQTATQSPLGAAKPFGSSFGLSSSTTGGFGQQATTTPATGGIFGSSTAAKPAFGAASTTTTGFGGFGQTTATQPASTGGIFGGFGSTQTPATGSVFGSTQQQPAAATASPFGQTTTGFGGFGSTAATAQPTTSAFGSGLTSAGFGASTTSGGFGSGFSTPGLTTGGATTGGLFGSSTTQAQPTSTFSFGGATATGGSSFLGGGVNTSLTNNFGGLGTGQNTSLNLNTTQQQQQLQVHQQGLMMDPAVQQQISALSNSPYGTSYYNMKKEADIFNPVSPLAQRAFINETQSPTKVSSLLSAHVGDVKGGLSQTVRITPKPLSTISLNKKTDLFEGLENEEVPCFYPRKNIKKLLFKPTINVSATESTSGRFSPSNSLISDTKIDFTRNKISSNSYHEDAPTGLARFSQNDYYNSNNQQQQPDSTNISEDGHIANENQSEVSQHHQHPANIILERPGYFTIPGMQELASMTDPKGDCLVESFSIGRVDYGCITFPGITNISNMNLDEIVHIRRKEVHIYPDEAKKPPIGQGLNKTAEVTLHRIWPTCKETKKPVTEPMRVIDMGYNKKIEKATVEMGAHFIDYDPTTGSWTFKVKHFSKYGLHDSDEDDEGDTCQRPVGVHSVNPIKACNQASSYLNAQLGSRRVDMDIKQEKDMIQKQLKLIETRRLELMQQRKSQFGSNLNTITNQQWDMLNEYVPGSKSEKASNALQLELSEESQIVNTDDEDTVDKVSTNSSEPQKKTLRKALILDNQTDDTDNDFDKENTGLFPTLSEYKGKKLNKDRLYPNLDRFDNGNKFEMDQKDFKYELHHGSVMNEEETMNGLPFVLAASNDRMLASTRANKTLMKAFFGEDQIDGDYMNMAEEDTKMKLASLVHQPQQFRLLKRGLGGMSIEEALETRMTLKREPHQLKPGPSKLTAMSLTLADVQQRIGVKNLKPKFFNKFSKKHPESKAGLLCPITKHKKNKQTNDMQTVDDHSHTELLKYISLNESITNGMHKCIADTRLFQMRRFRANWSYNPTSCTYTSLCLNAKGTDFSSVRQSSPLMFTLGNSPIQFDVTASSDEKVSLVRSNCEKFLQTQLSQSDLGLSNSGIGIFRTKPGNSLIRHCHSLVQDMRNSIGDHPDADNIEHMKWVWSLCQRLWGDIPDSYKIDGVNFDAESDNNIYEREQIRKRLLGEWLADVSAHRVDRECKMSKFNKCKDSHLNSIFSLLTANRLLDACRLAADSHDYRLAMLLAQTSGGSQIFRDMIRKQIKEWMASGTDKYLNSERLKIYVMISGELTQTSENAEMTNVCENLDWKRQYGMHLWYKCLPINSIHDSLISFEDSLASRFVAEPLPPYLEDSVTSDLKNNQPTHLYDTCFHLIKLYCNDKHSIADTVSPLSHNPNQLDYRLSWHLTMALISLSYNSVSSECLESLHESYASQLQSIGLWHWSVFVLMHLEDEKRRESAVRGYLSRYVTSESELTEKEKFVIESLVVPREWVYEMKAQRAKYEYKYENQFKLLVKAHKWNEAHSVLIELLAPDMFIKSDLKTLNDYLMPLAKESESINKWNLGGQVYLDYISLHHKATGIFDFSSDEQTIIHADSIKEMNNQIISLSNRVKELKDLDCSTNKKLLVCIQISKMLLNFFNVLIELNNSEINQIDDNDELLEESGAKKLTKSMYEKAYKATESIPYHEIIQTMVMVKTKHTRTYLRSFQPY